MTVRDTVELFLLALASVATWLAQSALPQAWPLGQVILCASALLLFQGLLRDLWITFRDRPVASGGQRIVCMCMESTVGVTGIVAGAAALLGGLGEPIHLDGAGWPLLVGCTGLVGFAIKDVIIDVQRRTVRREKNHRSVVVW